MNQFIKIYNQTLQYFTRNWCTIYTLFWILSDQYYLTFAKDDLIIKFAKEAQESKMWYEAWWAWFDKIYNYFCDKVYDRTNIRLRVLTVNINSKEFETYLFERNKSFWLWLLKANSSYKKMAIDRKLTKEDIDIILKSKWWTWHNHRFRVINWRTCIIESLWFDVSSTKENENIIECPLDVLRYAVEKWLYSQNARTLQHLDTEENKILIWFLKEISENNWKDSYYTSKLEELNLQWNEDKKRIFMRASRLYSLKK